MFPQFYLSKGNFAENFHKIKMFQKNRLAVSSNERRGSEFSSHEIELRNRVMHYDVTLRVSYSKIFIEILFASY